jgi:hypothetical protein
VNAHQDQHDPQQKPQPKEEQPQEPQPKEEPQDPGREFAKKGVLAAIAGGCSGTARALWQLVLGNSE